jgi:ABC-2 type transport system permease protein
MKLFWHTLNLEARKAMSYRVDFWINSVAGFFIQLGVVYFLWKAIFSESGSERIGEYDFSTLLLFYILVILIGKLVRGMEFSTGIAQDIYDGGLSRYLVYPTNYFGFKYAQHLGSLLPAVVQLFIFGGLAPFIIEIPVNMGLPQVAMVIPTILLANLLYYQITLPLQAIAFWADNVWSLLVLLRMMSALLGGSMIPIDLFPEWAQGVLLWTPFPYLFNFPVFTLMGKISPLEWAFGVLITIFWVVLFGVLTKWIWRKGELKYTGVGI